MVDYIIWSNIGQSCEGDFMVRFGGHLGTAPTVS